MKTADKKLDVVALLLERGASSPVSTPALIRCVSEGFSSGDIRKLSAFLGMSPEAMAPYLGISTATLTRRMRVGKMDAAESDRIARFARIAGIAAHVLGSAEAARGWLRSPQFGLGGAIPLEYARREVGAREVENLLGRIEYGVYS